MTAETKKVKIELENGTRRESYGFTFQSLWAAEYIAEMLAKEWRTVRVIDGNTGEIYKEIRA